MLPKSKNKHARFYALLGKLGLRQTDRRDFIFDYTHGVTDSLSYLAVNYPELYLEMISDMEALAQKADTEANRWRKRVMASVGGWLKLMARDSNSDIIKAIACRATGYDDFNLIPVQRLISVYNTFLKKQKDFKVLTKGMSRELAVKTLLN